MPSNDDSLIERVQSSYKQLSDVATTLNTASDGLGKTIAALDEALKRLNLGIPGWVNFNEGASEDDFYFSYDQVGYDKIGGKWAIAIRALSGNQAEGESVTGTWIFTDAPRNLRINAVDKIPDLIEKLIKEAESTTKRIIAKTTKAQQLVDALAPKPKTSTLPLRPLSNLKVRPVK